MDPLEKLHQNYKVLSDAKDEIVKFESQYLEIISATKGLSSEKRLASQFICEFYDDFPNLQQTAVDALFDLCKDHDVEIRKQVIKDLPSICKNHQENVSKITEILCKLLNTDYETEIQIIHLSLISLSNISLKHFLTGLFAQIKSSDEIIKERAIKFLHDKIKTIPEDFWSNEHEEFILDECKKILVDSSKERFAILMNILLNLKICKRISGQQVLLDIVNQNIHLESDINPEDKESLENFLFYLKYAIGCFSLYVCSNQYVEFICNRILSKHQLIQEEDQLKENFCIVTILQYLGELTNYIQPTVTAQLINLKECENIVFNKLLVYLPEVQSDTSIPIDYKYDYLEPLLFAFHNFGKKNCEEIVNDIGEENLKKFKKRIKQLRLSCYKSIGDLQTPVISIEDLPNSPKAVAFKCIQNIRTIIKNMFYLKPIFKISLVPSWKFSSSTVISLDESHATPTHPTINASYQTIAENSKNVSNQDETTNKRKSIMASEKDLKDLKIQKSVNEPSDLEFSPLTVINLNKLHTDSSHQTIDTVDQTSANDNDVSNQNETLNERKLSSYIEVIGNDDEKLEMHFFKNQPIALKTLKSVFPGATGLKFLNPETNLERGIVLSKDRLMPPEKGWAAFGPYYCLYNLEYKRQLEEYKKRAKTNKCSELVVLSLSKKISEDELKEYFEKFGETVMVQIKKDPKTGQSKGFGFVKFSNYDAQMRVVGKRHKLLGKLFDVKMPSRDEGEFNYQSSEFNLKIYVGKITEDFTCEDLRNYFSKFGEISDIYIPEPFKSFAFVTFKDSEIVQKICSEDHVIKNIAVQVNNAIPKVEINSKGKGQYCFGRTPKLFK